MDIHITQDFAGNYYASDSDTYCGQPDDFIGFGYTADEAKRDLYEMFFNTTIYSFDEIRQEYLNINIPYMDFEEFLKKNFIPVYDNDLNFVGYEKEPMSFIVEEY